MHPAARLQAAIDRANESLEAGADLALVEAPTSLVQLQAIPKQVAGPCVLNVLLGGKSPLLSLQQIEQTGYRMVLLSDVMLTTAIAAYDSALQTIRSQAGPLRLEHTLSPKEIFRRLGSEAWDDVPTA